MILYGASGHAMVISDTLSALNIKLIHLFDDNKNKSSYLNVQVTEYKKDIFPEESLIISIGHNLHRKNISKKVSHNFGHLIHPSAHISSKINIGEGTVILHNSTIQIATVIGKHCIINTASSIDHECILNDFVHISPHATLCGNVIVGEGTQIGAGAIILPNIKIGSWCIIGAGTVVNKDIPDDVVVVGNPGKIIKNNTYER